MTVAYITWLSHQVPQSTQFFLFRFMIERSMCVCLCVLDLYEGAPGGQPAGVHHAGPAALRRLQQRRTPQPA